MIKRAVMIFACVSAMNITASSYAAGDLEFYYDRPGYDYKQFFLPVNNPMVCKEACGGEPSCKAFPYAPPGVMGTNAYCWLKSSVPSARVDRNRITWVKPN